MNAVMRMSLLLGARFKETPSDCQIDSHALMLRGGYIKNVGNGIFSLYTPAKRIVRKIEAILREEMDRIGGQEVLLPVVMPAALWRESGRYDAVGSELVRFQDRGEAAMVLGMTHEEAVVHLARGTAQSYTSYPFMVYQLQTKFRDEPRARGGLIRVREFTMKDAYSFHTTQEDLEAYYETCHQAYERIFARVGLPEVLSVQSDSGMMGGKVAHEFMLLTEVGEDTLVVCPACGYRSNMEVAACVLPPAAPAAPAALTRAATPGRKTIEDICDFFGVTPRQTCKAVVYRKNATNEPVVVFLRGDLEVNETKLRNFLREEIHPAPADEAGSGLCPGYIGPVSLKTDAVVLFDRSLNGAENLICGANEEGFHYTGFSPARDVAPAARTDGDFAKAFAGGVCPSCGAPGIQISRGIEVGNIFQLGTRYTEAMDMRYLDKDGTLRYPIMGCYGIGVGRVMASVCEVRRDAFGPIWPMSIAPWQVHICGIRGDDAQVRETAEALYRELERSGIEVLYDDRVVSAGVAFSDADLLGVPLRVIVSPKTCARGVVEVRHRDKSFSEDAAISDAPSFVRELVEKQLAAYRI